MSLIKIAKEIRNKTLSEEEKALIVPLTNIASIALRAGVSMTLDEFAALSDVERIAFARAGDALEKDRAARIGVSAWGEEGLAMAMEDETLMEALEHQKVVNGARR